MDPISTSASILTLLGAAGGTCKVLYGIFHDIKDAPKEIRQQNKSLRRLQENISFLSQVCGKLPEELQLAARFDGIQEFFDEVHTISANVERRNKSLERGKVHRVKEICSWSLYDRQLGRFFDNLEHYNTILGQAISAAQLSLLMQIRDQTSAVELLRLYTQAYDRDKISPNTNTSITPVGSMNIGYGSSDTGVGVPIKEKRLLARLSKCVETLGPLLHHRWELGVGTTILDLRLGPSITRRWSQQGQEMFSKEGHALAVTLDCNRFVRQRITLVLCIMHHTSSMSRLSLTTNLTFSSLAPSESPIFSAIVSGDVGQLKHMIAAEPLAMSTVTRGGYTLLHFAARFGRQDILSILVDNGADINTTNDCGETPLHIAMKQGRDNSCTQHLLELGANPSQPDAEGRTALHMFYNPITAWMFQYHSDDIDTWAQDTLGRTVLHYLAWSSRSTTQELERCLQMAGVSQLYIKDSQGRSILHYATQRGNTDLINFLLDRPEVDSLCMPDYLGRTLLHHATESGRVSTIDLFLARNLDHNAVDNASCTILHHACRWGNLKAVKHLLDLGLEYQLDAVDDEKRTPLQLARHYRSKAVVKYLEELCPEMAVRCEKSDDKIVASGSTKLPSLASWVLDTRAFSFFVFLFLTTFGVWKFLSTHA